MKKEKCLFGCTVEKGTKLIGWFFLSYRLIVIVFSMYGYNIALDDLSKAEPGSDIERKRLSFLNIALILLAILPVLAICDAILLIGVYKLWPAFILLWLIVGVNSLFVVFMNLPGVMIQPPYVGDIFSQIISVGIHVYCLRIVYSHYEILKAISGGWCNCCSVAKPPIIIF